MFPEKEQERKKAPGMLQHIIPGAFSIEKI